MKHQKLFSLIALMMLACSHSAEAHDFEVEHQGKIIYYNILTDNTCAVTYKGDSYSSYDEYIGDIEIPASVTYEGKTYSVTEIGYGAFASCSNMTGVEIPNSITAIKTDAFFDCENIISVTVPHSVSSLGNRVFGCCSKLRYVVIGNSVTYIPKETFYQCSNLTSLTIGSAVASIGDNAFLYCSSLAKLILLPTNEPTKLTSSLTAIPSIGRTTYVASDNYRSNIYGTVKKYASLLSCFEVDGVRYIPLSISERTCAAIDCTYAPGIKNIVIGKTVNYRGIKMNVTEINEDNLLVNNDKLESVDIAAPANINTNFAKQCPNLKSIILSNVESIGESCFENLSKLEKVYLGETITKIGKSAFYNCIGIKSIYIKALVPPTCASKAFDNINKWDCTLYVQESVIDNYLSADHWKDFLFTTYWDFEKEEEIPAEPQPSLNGDMDGDGQITMSDANAIVNMYLGNK